MLKECSNSPNCPLEERLFQKTLFHGFLPVQNDTTEDVKIGPSDPIISVMYQKGFLPCSCLMHWFGRVIFGDSFG